MDINIQLFVAIIMMKYGTNDNVNKETNKIMIPNTKRTHTQSSPTDSDGVQPHQCQTSYSSYICITNKTELHSWKYPGKDNNTCSGYINSW